MMGGIREEKEGITKRVGKGGIKIDKNYMHKILLLKSGSKHVR